MAAITIVYNRTKEGETQEEIIKNICVGLGYQEKVPYVKDAKRELIDNPITPYQFITNNVSEYLERLYLKGGASLAQSKALEDFYKENQPK